MFFVRRHGRGVYIKMDGARDEEYISDRIYGDGEEYCGL